jgi:isopentenyldiphosphate isomerase
MAKIVIVDENDNMIGIKEKSEVNPTDIGRVTGLWVVNSKNEVLISKRNMTKKFSPGCWEPAVAGTVEEGESYEDNMYKEAEEELGITGVVFQKWTKLRISSDHEYFVQIYKATLDWEINRFKPEMQEFDEIKWIDFDELAKDVDAHPEKYTKAVPLIISQI